ncbi:hypothetical protein [Bifidobacterium platyrrhinorum]|uniref:Uncharacterized protein n=1 Tax=Bifidobacterium platyrrhinorum TaxID=2661628 RepID=A0A6L9SS63_9BIFI|nr:hypothetical protein [Bifidobacterium platyrrhinorum]NEG55015.1 hypothetical protein [Bifidobacterium platyrrhinorum]
MGYEQLSTVIVLIIVLIGIVVWLPIRTTNSMRHVEEHREDRYSSSLHLVDADSGTRFSDDTTYAKGVLMQPNERRANTLSPGRIAEVRRLRREAVRRRQIIVICLVVVTVAVAAAAFALHFSPWFALIPAALAGVVLALGARAAGQAREWERKVAQARSRERKARLARARTQARTVDAKASRVEAEAARLRPAVSEADEPPAGEDTPTAEMEGREIRRVLRQAQTEQRQALAARGKLPSRAAADAEVASVEETPVSARPSVDMSPVKSAGPVSAEETPASTPTSASAAKVATEVAADADATDELAEVRPARALDVVDMATPSPELISFSLGEPRNVVEEKPAPPESREIKSMRQVAKATPVDETTERELAAEAKVETAPAKSDPKPSGETDTAGSTAANADPADAAHDSNDGSVLAAVPDDAGVTDVAAFHESEEQARVAVPAATSDSLGNGLQAILARRQS